MAGRDISQNVREWRAADGRLIALLVRGEFVADRPAHSPTRHQIMLCERGACQVGIYTKEGEHLDDVILYPKDFILLCEGHAFEVLGDDTKLIEIKQGPFPETDAQDMVRLRP